MWRIGIALASEQASSSETIRRLFTHSQKAAIKAKEGPNNKIHAVVDG